MDFLNFYSFKHGVGENIVNTPYDGVGGVNPILNSVFFRFFLAVLFHFFMLWIGGGGPFSPSV